MSPANNTVDVPKSSNMKNIKNFGEFLEEFGVQLGNKEAIT